MCGIGFYWARERTIDRDAIRKLFEGAAKRGGDGFGYCLVRAKGGDRMVSELVLLEKVADPKFWDTHVLDIESNMRAGDLLFLSFRATPETELQTTPEMLQPIISPETGCVLIHNGSVTETDNKGLRKHEEIGTFKWNTQIDSEAIIAQYINYGRDMKKCMEDLSGAFAFVLLDWKSRKLYAVNSFLPLAHMYIKGYGYFLHSSNDALGEVLQDIVGTSKDGMNVWEYWYHHYLDGYTIIETDLDSGFQKKSTYRPKFLSPTIFSRKEKQKEPKSIYIAASGGIDSGVTALALKHFLPEKNWNIAMVHFKYGQRSQESEEWAVRKLSETLGIQLQILDISSIYTDFIKDCGMLMNRSNAIQSGGDKLKSTIAWVSARNAIFASLLLAKAESRLLYRKDREVYIAGGWAQLSEECLTLHKNNKVNTVERGNIPPQDVHVGDWLWACDIETKRPVRTQVKEVRERTVTHVVRIKYKTRGYGFVECSRSHPFYVSGKGWVKAVDIKPGDEIWRKVGWDRLLINWDELKDKEQMRSKIEKFAGISIHNGIKVLEVEVIEREEKVVNYHCEPHNNFFVNSLLVHNTGGYPDNSFKFIEALTELKKYGCITGADIHFLNVLQNLTKTETWKLGAYLKFPFQYSVSCDNPTMDDDGVPTLCLECGSTKLSCIAADRADVYDPRRFNTRLDVNRRGVCFRTRFSEPAKVADVQAIINRLNLPV